MQSLEYIAMISKLLWLLLVNLLILFYVLFICKIPYRTVTYHKLNETHKFKFAVYKKIIRCILNYIQITKFKLKKNEYYIITYYLIMMPFWII